MVDLNANPHALLGVYRPDAVDPLVGDLSRVGVDSADIRVGEPEDVTTGLEAEMLEEASESFVSPQGGVLYSKEATKATAVLGPVLAVIGAVVALPLALAMPNTMALWTRVVLALIVGAVLGGTIAAVVLPAMAVKSQLRASAAQRGSVVRVTGWSVDVERVMAEADPLRLDRLDAQMRPIDVVTTEEDREPGGIAEEVIENTVREAKADPEDRTR